MKIFVMVDMEGISGVFESAQVLPGSEHYPTGRKYLTWDVNACVEGCFQGGATRVIVRDAHGGGDHFVWEDLDPRGEYMRGHSPKRMPDLVPFDGQILLGYHAMAGTPEAILEHTMSSKHWQNFWMNGRKSGEIAIDAAIAGDHGVPTIMVSGDDKACGEARRLLPGAVAVQVKKGLDVEGGILLSKAEALKKIVAGAAKAVAGCKSMTPYRVRHPVTMRLEVVSRGRIPVNRTGVRVVDGRTYEVKAETVEQALNAL